jgi:hypothetical protein
VDPQEEGQREQGGREGECDSIPLRN